jgi:serine/threonine protein kinase
MSAPTPRKRLLLNRYRIERELGRGGMGTVDLVLQTDLERYVALKRILPENVGIASAEGWFRREYKALAAIRHSGVPAVYDCGKTEDNVSYFTMEAIEGPSLRVALETRRFTATEAIATAIDLARILAAAHAVGVVHRDVKPANVILEAGGRVRLIDFGICFFLPNFRARASNLRSVGPDDYQTGPMEVAAGTSGYGDPALLDGHPVSVQSDIFSVAAVLYEMLAGRRLHDEKMGRFRAIDSAEFAPELLPVVTEIRRGAELLPRDRHASMDEFVRALEIALSAVRRAEDRSRSRVAGTVYLGLSLVNIIVLAVLGWSWATGRLFDDGASSPAAPAHIAGSSTTAPAEPIETRAAPTSSPSLSTAGSTPVAPAPPTRVTPESTQRPTNQARPTRSRSADDVSQALVDQVTGKNAGMLRKCLQSSEPLNLEIMVEAGRARLTRVEWVPFDRRSPRSSAESCLSRALEGLQFPHGGPPGPYHVEVGPD